MCWFNSTLRMTLHQKKESILDPHFYSGYSDRSTFLDLYTKLYFSNARVALDPIPILNKFVEDHTNFTKENIKSNYQEAELFFNALCGTIDNPKPRCVFFENIQALIQEKTKTIINCCDPEPVEQITSPPTWMPFVTIHLPQNSEITLQQMVNNHFKDGIEFDAECSR